MGVVPVFLLPTTSAGLLSVSLTAFQWHCLIKYFCGYSLKVGGWHSLVWHLVWPPPTFLAWLPVMPPKAPHPDAPKTLGWSSHCPVCAFLIPCLLESHLSSLAWLKDHHVYQALLDRSLRESVPTLCTCILSQISQSLSTPYCDYLCAPIPSARLGSPMLEIWGCSLFTPGVQHRAWHKVGSIFCWIT